MAGYTMPEAAALCREHDLLPREGHVLCAVSGGADSVCLLHWLNGLREEYGFILTAAHYNHQLRGEQSLRDEEFVRSFVGRCCPGVELVVGSGDVAAQAQKDGTGIEETAREMRYTFLRETARQVGADVIATAHNAEDNAETMLLHLMRGSGLRGLTGIQPRRDMLVRPFLTTRRREIEAYLRIYGLPHVEDGSNADERFARNRVRRQLLPVLEDMQPQIISHMGKTARLLTQDEEYLTQQARQALGEVEKIRSGLRVCAAAISGQPDAIAVRMVRLLLDRLNGDGGKCTAQHLLDVVGLCRSDDPSGRISLPGGRLARRVYERLELVAEQQREQWGEETISVPGTLTLPWGTITARYSVYEGQGQTPFDFYLSCGDDFVVRARRTGDRLERPGRMGRPLKKILIDEKIPQHSRDAIPVLDRGGQVAAVAGLGPDRAFLPEVGQECWHITCIPNVVQIEKGCCLHDGT